MFASHEKIIIVSVLIIVIIIWIEIENNVDHPTSYFKTDSWFIMKFFDNSSYVGDMLNVLETTVYCVVLLNIAYPISYHVIYVHYRSKPLQISCFQNDDLKFHIDVRNFFMPLTAGSGFYLLRPSGVARYCTAEERRFLRRKRNFLNPFFFTRGLKVGTSHQ